MIDNIDLKILSAIDTNARATYSELSKQLKISKSKVQYRLTNLINQGIIKKFVTQPSLNKLGFFLSKFYLVLSGMNLTERENLVRSLCEEEDISWVAKTKGQWDLMIGVFVRNSKELLEVKKKILLKYGNKIESIDLTLLGEGHTSPRQYLFKTKKSRVVKEYSGELVPGVELKKDEKEILKFISEDARFNYLDLCEKVNLDVKTVKKRLKGLMDKGIIQGFVTFLDVKKLGYQFFKICIFLKDSKDMEKIIQFGLNHPNVIHVIESVGSWDLEFEVETKSFEELFYLEEELINSFSDSIKKIYSTIIEEEVKLEFVPKKI